MTQPPSAKTPYSVPEITLYGFVPQDRSGRVRWLLEEMGIPYKEKSVD